MKNWVENNLGSQHPFRLAFEKMQLETERLQKILSELPANGPAPRYCDGCSDCWGAHEKMFQLRQELRASFAQVDLLTTERNQLKRDNDYFVQLKKGFTCNTCTAATTCAFAWDLYNTNGDCLAEK